MRPTLCARLSALLLVVAWLPPAAQASVPGKPDAKPVASANGGDRPAAQSQPATRPALVLPPPPEGVTHLEFGEIFKSPNGPRGAEYTDRAKQLDGKRVRMVGYMVKPAHRLENHAGHGHSHSENTEASTQPERWFMFCAAPITINDAEFGLADDLPLSTVCVRLADSDPGSAAYRPGPFVLTGTLRLGREEQPDKRVTWVRLSLDSPLVLDSPTTAPAGRPGGEPLGDERHKHGESCDHKHDQQP
jgi:hypothetical protein